MAMYDQLVINGKIYSLEREGESFAAFGCNNGKITKLFEQIPANPGSLAKTVIDVQGKTVLPAFIDSHCHFMSTAALQEIALSISEVENGKLMPDCMDGVKEKVQTFAAKKDPKKPILCFNYVIASIKEDRLPLKEEIDRWLPNRTVIFLSMDGHSSAYSSSALHQMGFDPKIHNGILSGEDHEFNVGKMDQIVMKSLSVSTLSAGVQHLINDAINHGILGIHCLDGMKETNDLGLWFLSKFAPSLPLYLRLFPQLLNQTEVNKFTSLMQYKRVGGCYQWEMDGSIGSQTASFYESFGNNPNNFGRLLHPYDEVLAKVREFYKNGYQIISHAIGTQGIDSILKAFDTVLTENNDLENKRRHRIEHFEFPTLDQVDRAIDRCHLIVSAQPGYSWMDETFQKAYRKYLRPKQFNRQIPLRTIVEKGGIICGSSDSPVQTIDPFIQLHGMVNFPLIKEQLTVYQALRCYTYNGAFSTFEEQTRGTLKVGKWADFIILNEDPFKIAKAHILDLKVQSTYLHGAIAPKMNCSTSAFLLHGVFGKKHKI